MVGVMLADATIRFTYLDGRAEEITGKAGQVPMFRPIEHLPESFQRSSIRSNCCGTEGFELEGEVNNARFGDFFVSRVDSNAVRTVARYGGHFWRNFR